MKKCEHCAHWHKQPANPTALNEVRGECREAPPSVTVLQGQDRMGQMMTMKFCAYPILPPEFPACSRFAARVAVNGEV